DATLEFLRGQGSFERWAESSLLWPDPTTQAAQAKAQFAAQLVSEIARSRTLLVIRAGDVEQRNPSEELDYMRVLGEALSEYSIASRQSPKPILQAVVIYELTSEAEILPARLSPLWPAGRAPQGCGVSLSLSKVRRDALQPWVTRLNAAWSP